MGQRRVKSKQPIKTLVCTFCGRKLAVRAFGPAAEQPKTEREFHQKAVHEKKWSYRNHIWRCEICTAMPKSETGRSWL